MLRWPEADLEARLGRALDIAERTVTFFSNSGFTDAESPSIGFRPEKPIAETAMLLYAASGVRDRPEIASRVNGIASILAPHARSERTMLDMALKPALAFVFAVPHVLLTKLGHPDPAFDGFLRTCASSQARNGHERPPFASLERRWITSLWTGENPGPGWRGDLRNGVLKWPLDILGGLRDDTYAFTHLLMYCTDFGHRAGRLPRQRSLVLSEARSLLARYLDAEDYDLAGEILLAWPFTGAQWCPTAAFAFRVLARVEDEIGVLPCGNTKAERLNQLEGDERTRYALGTAYHTAYVMGFLCAAALRPGNAPPLVVAGRKGEQEYLDRVMDFLDTDQGHWQPLLAELPNTSQRALLPFLLDIALVQKNRKNDYQAMNELLALANHYGAATSPMCGQAAELLGRLASYSATMRSRNA